MNLFESLKQVVTDMNEFKSYYLGSSLYFENPAEYISIVCLDVTGKGWRDHKDGTRKYFNLSPEEHQVLAKIYLKYKSEDHPYYDHCFNIVYGKKR